MTSLASVVARIKYVVQMYSVEVIVFLSLYAYSVIFNLNPSLDERKVAESCDTDVQPLTREEAAIYVQDKQTAWTMYRRLANVPISMLVSLLLGAYGDRHGRQVNMLVGITGGVVLIGSSLAFYSSSLSLPLWSSIPLYSVAALFGDYYVTVAAANSYIVDTVPDKEMVAIRIVFVNVAFSLGGTLLSVVMGTFSENINVNAWYLCGEMIYCVVFVYTLFLIPQIRPTKMKRSVLGIRRMSTQIYAQNRCLQLFNDVFCLLKDSWRTFTVSRTGRKRLILWLIMLVVFLDVTSTTEISLLFGIYTKRDEFNWTPATLSWYNACRNVARMLGQLVGAPVFKRCFGLSDTVICLIGIASLAAQIISQAVGSTTWHLFVGAALSLFSGLIQPSISTFQARLVPSCEVGKIFAITVLAQNGAILVQLLGVQNVYKATAESAPGLAWWSIVLLLCVMAALIAVVHVLYRIDGRKGLNQRVNSNHNNGYK